MAKPLIGISTYRTPGQMTIYDGELCSLPSQYIEAINRADGVAVMIPPQDLELNDLQALIGRIDALVIAGGADISPSRYGQEAEPETQPTEELRDNLEDLLLQEARSQKLPILGVCRGAQMLNVHLGGTLHQHLPKIVGHDRYRVGDGSFHAETMQIEEGSRLEKILEAKTAPGFVYHHQAIDMVGPNLRVTARGFDGTIQAIEMEDYPFGLAVQWHPEEDLSNNKIFESLVAEARARQRS